MANSPAKICLPSPDYTVLKILTKNYISAINNRVQFWKLQKRHEVDYALTPCEPKPEPSYSPCRPDSPKRSYKDLFSSSDRTYMNALLTHERKWKEKGENIIVLDPTIVI